MLDYRGIEALYAVQEYQSFEIAAKKLHITQSAISQRIKALENHYGEPVLIRSLPYTTTQLGAHLIQHYKQVGLLEESLQKNLQATNLKTTFTIAINRDSLETWFLSLIEQTPIFTHVTLEVIADDQELTLDYLKKGLATACLSTSSKEIIGGKAVFLGNMDYQLVASPAYAKLYFSDKKQKKCLTQATAIKFDKKDVLHEKYLEKFFGLKADELHFHIIPSVRAFKKYIVLGYGYGLVPTIDIQEELKHKKLISLYPNNTWKIPLFWHYWDLPSKTYQKFNTDIIHYIQNVLKP